MIVKYADGYGFKAYSQRLMCLSEVYMMKGKNKTKTILTPLSGKGNLWVNSYILLGERAEKGLLQHGGYTRCNVPDKTVFYFYYQIHNL